MRNNAIGLTIPRAHGGAGSFGYRVGGPAYRWQGRCLYVYAGACMGGPERDEAKRHEAEAERQRAEAERHRYRRASVTPEEALGICVGVATLLMLVFVAMMKWWL